MFIFDYWIIICFVCVLVSLLLYVYSDSSLGIFDCSRLVYDWFTILMLDLYVWVVLGSVFLKRVIILLLIVYIICAIEATVIAIWGPDYALNWFINMLECAPSSSPSTSGITVVQCNERDLHSIIMSGLVKPRTPQEFNTFRTALLHQFPESRIPLNVIQNFNLNELSINILRQLPGPMLVNLPINVLIRLPVDSLVQLPVVTLMHLPVNTLIQLPVDSLSQLPVTTLQQLPMNTLLRLPPITLSQLPLTLIEQFPLSTLQQMPISSISRLPLTTLQQLPLSCYQKLPAEVLIGFPKDLIHQLPADVLADINSLKYKVSKFYNSGPAGSMSYGIGDRMTFRSWIQSTYAKVGASGEYSIENAPLGNTINTLTTPVQDPFGNCKLGSSKWNKICHHYGFKFSKLTTKIVANSNDDSDVD